MYEFATWMICKGFKEKSCSCKKTCSSKKKKKKKKKQIDGQKVMQQWHKSHNKHAQQL